MNCVVADNLTVVHTSCYLTSKGLFYSYGTIMKASVAWKWLPMQLRKS